MSIRYYERIGKNSGVSMPLWLAFIVYTFALAVVAVALLALAAVWALWLLVVLGDAGWSRHKRRPRRLRVDPTAVEEPQRFIDTGERQRLAPASMGGETK